MLEWEPFINTAKSRMLFWPVRLWILTHISTVCSFRKQRGFFTYPIQLRAFMELDFGSCVVLDWFLISQMLLCLLQPYYDSSLIAWESSAALCTYCLKSHLFNELIENQRKLHHAGPIVAFTAETPGYIAQGRLLFSVHVKLVCSVGSSSDVNQTLSVMAVKASFNILLAWHYEMFLTSLDTSDLTHAVYLLSLSFHVLKVNRKCWSILLCTFIITD